MLALCGVCAWCATCALSVQCVFPSSLRLPSASVKGAGLREPQVVRTARARRVVDDRPAAYTARGAGGGMLH
eukprot:COSAG06_NODE_3281_length_5562_cov_5.218927_4_plen_72_part_00